MNATRLQSRFEPPLMPEGRQYSCRVSSAVGLGRIGGMVFSFLYLPVWALLGALVRGRRGLHGNDIELLVLRHELEILRRQVARPKLKPTTSTDRIVRSSSSRRSPLSHHRHRLPARFTAASGSAA
jgi:hypothetical protein